MKSNYRWTVLLLCDIMWVTVNAAYAQWNAISSGYAVTTDCHGIEVPPGTLVTATAGTTDTNVTNVTFLWKYPNGTTAHTDANVLVQSNGSTWDGKLIYYASSSFIPSVPGNWSVQAFFIGEGGTEKANVSDVIMIRATSFNVIPDFPVVGTAGAIISMLLGLSLFLRKNKRKYLF